MGALRLVRTIPVREWPDVVAAAGVALVVEIGLRTVGLPRLSRWMGAPLQLDGAPDAPDFMFPSLEPWAKRRLSAVRRVLRHWPFGDTCLRLALVSGRRLRKLGPMLRVGVTKQDGELKAHAWLEIDGVSLDPAAPQLFAVLAPVGKQ